ncbi:MAG: TIGR01212 family radical SAM protein [Muribaculaceae bacterium]|nr:TIGR01212 family radical SAM protein [Muribaculaceae bacterium]
MNPYYKDYSQYLCEKFGGGKIQKLSVDAGFSCPNRDGTISRGGCIYCNVRSFTPGYCNPMKTVGEQLEEGKRFFARKYPDMKYLAYFQSFTGTHARAVDSLRQLYEEAAVHPDVVGIVIGTRPDCLPKEVVEMLASLNRMIPVIVEIGAETSHDRTLQIINRGHKWQDTVDSVNALHEHGIDVGLHLIAGLPGEGRDDILESLDDVMKLPVSTIKYHQLQIIRDTALASMMQEGRLDVNVFGMEDYMDLCVEIIGRLSSLRPDIAIERFLSSAPKGMVIAPGWGLKNHEFVNLLMNRLRVLNLRNLRK